MDTANGDSTPTQRSSAASASLPLAGVKVLDLTRALAGPFCTMILGDLGADIVKVEPLDGDMIRDWGPHDRGISAYYLSGNRNKRSLSLNFRSPSGLSLLRDLASKSDVIVENFRPGTMKAMGLDYEELAAEQPALIYASISGFGRTGPVSELPGFDQIAQGYSGLMSMTGMPETGPTRVGVAIGDQTAGMWAALGVIAALYDRRASGKGRQVETSLLAGLVGLLSVQGQRYLSLGEIPIPSGNSHPVISPYGVFRTGDGPLNLAPATGAMWTRLCGILELQGLVDDPRFANNTTRVEHREELKRLIEERLSGHPRRYWMSRFAEAGIPCGPINNLAEVFADEQVNHCSMVEKIEHPTLGPLQLVSSPIKLNGDDARVVLRHPPLLGEHTFELLREFGYSEAMLSELTQAEAVWQHA